MYYNFRASFYLSSKYLLEILNILDEGCVLYRLYEMYIPKELNFNWMERNM